MSNRITEAQDITEVLESEEVLVDITDDENGLEDEELEEASTESEDEAKLDEEDNDNLPDKFKGKTIAEIVDSYSNLEKEYGRRNNEIGELRKLTDQLLDLERKPKEIEEAADETLDADSLLEDPTKAIRKTLENDPTLQGIKDSLLKTERNDNLKKFDEAHPDWKETMVSEKFLKWIGGSKVRTQMFIDADKNYDYETGSDLLNDFKELNPAESTDTEADEQADKEKLEADHKAITTEKKSKSKGSRRKIYSRAQIINMKINNPTEYERRRDEFDKAYTEGRVR